MTRNGKFTLLQRLLHWLMAIAIIAMLFIGVGMVSTVAPKHVLLLTTHKTLGLAILLLVILRIIVRLRTGTPPLPRDLPPPMRLAAKLSHYALYALMLGMPLIGWAMQSAGAYPIVLLGGIQLPAILAPDAGLYTLLHSAHVMLGLAFFALILLHIAAALFHALIRRDGVFQSMAGGRLPAE
jgi:cytochrome b561